MSKIEMTGHGERSVQIAEVSGGTININTHDASAMAEMFDKISEIHSLLCQSWEIGI